MLEMWVEWVMTQLIVTRKRRPTFKKNPRSKQRFILSDSEGKIEVKAEGAFVYSISEQHNFSFNE
jgi:hypothetical protein